MYHSNRVRFGQHQRPFWLLVALAVMLLATVSITVAAAATPARLIDSLQRDLSALRAQLEQIGPWVAGGGPETVAFDTELGDGGPAFRRLSMVTVSRAAARDLERLIGAWRAAGDRRAWDAETLRLGMYALTERIDRLRAPASPADTEALRGQAEVLLGQLEQDLAGLIAPSPATSGSE